MSSYQITLKDHTTDQIDDADAYQQEGQMTTFFRTESGRNVLIHGAPGWRAFGPRRFFPFADSRAPPSGEMRRSTSWPTSEAPDPPPPVPPIARTSPHVADRPGARSPELHLPPVCSRLDRGLVRTVRRLSSRPPLSVHRRGSVDRSRDLRAEGERDSQCGGHEGLIAVTLREGRTAPPQKAPRPVRSQ